jgi:predicted Zn-dependent protease with MMP-like domain/Flp pilus assembly protein TadD
VPKSEDGGDLDDVLSRVDEALVVDDDPKEAVRLVDQALRRMPDEPELHHARGVALRRQDLPDEALEAFRRAMELAPHMPDAWLDAAEVLLDDAGDAVAALELLDDAAEALEEPALQAEVNLLRGIALGHLEDFTGALRALEEARRQDSGHPDVDSERGSVLLELLRLDDAEVALRAAIAGVPEDARAHHLLGFLLDYSGRRDEAVAMFQRAGELDDELPKAPPRLGEKAFDHALEKALAAIPEPFRERLANVEIGVENYASREFCRRHDCSPTTLGIYVGTPLPERRDANAQALPDRIVLFQRAIENTCEDEDEVSREIGVTLRHEVGHLLGFSEDELHERGHG